MRDEPRHLLVYVVLFVVYVVLGVVLMRVLGIAI